MASLIKSIHPAIHQLDFINVHFIPIMPLITTRFKGKGTFSITLPFEQPLNPAHSTPSTTSAATAHPPHHLPNNHKHRKHQQDANKNEKDNVIR